MEQKEQQNIIEKRINILSQDEEEIFKNIKEGFFGLVINISVPNKIRNYKEKTNGYYIRRLSIDYGVDVIINIKCAKLYAESIVSIYENSKNRQ